MLLMWRGWSHYQQLRPWRRIWSWLPSCTFYGDLQWHAAPSPTPSMVMWVTLLVTVTKAEDMERVRSSRPQMWIMGTPSKQLSAARR